MQVYKQGQPITGLSPAGFLRSAGAKFTGPESIDSWRIDFGSLQSFPVVGVWSATKGKFDLPYGVSEIATILEGRVIVSLNGESHQLTAGDSFFVPKGEVVNWEILEDVKKCFMVVP